MAVISLSNIVEVFKILNPDGIESLVYEASPTLGMCKKWNGFYGESKRLDWMISGGGGARSTFATAQARAGVPVHFRPTITRKSLYAVRQLDRQSLLASKKNEGALVELVKHATMTAVDELKKRAGSLLMGNGTGAVGRISSGSNVATTAITLEDITQVVNFEEGGVYHTFTAGDGAANAGDVTLAAGGINEDTGVLTATAAWSTASTGCVAGDYIVPEDDYLNVPMGMFGWNPSTLITSGDSFFGINRSNSVPMQGFRYAPGSGSVDEIIMDALARHRGEHDSLILNPVNWGALNAQSTNWQRINKNAIGSDGKPIANIAYQAIVVNGPRGAVNVYSDAYMPLNKGKLTKMSDWELWSLESPFDLMTEGTGEGGATVLPTADGIEMRFGGYWNYVTQNPRNSMDITFV
jgi:hypothetical protein